MKVVHNQTSIGERHRIENIMANAENSTVVTNIAFVVLAENGAIDDVTAAEHISIFEEWHPNINYIAGNIRSQNGELYKCLQSHKSQEDWTPDKTPSLWKKIGDPTEEWPEWSQPIGSIDAYMMGDKTSHNGKHWESEIDNNVWEPGVYGWREVA